MQEYIKAQNEQFEAEKQNFDKPLSKEEIKKAKEEQQMITQIVEEIDKASQDYAEDVEFGTNTLIASGGILGAAAGFAVKGIMSLIQKIKGKNVKEAAQKTIEKAAKQTSKKGKSIFGLPVIAGFIGLTFASIVATKLQKQASRVARFKVMQDFQNNPEKLMYIEDDKLKDVEISNTDKKEDRKENLFKFYVRLFKENMEYNKYKKENDTKTKKLRLAKNDIELTEKQKADAKQLQQNIFKTFNKIDDKSQTYSESTEALGAIVKEYGSTFLSLGGTILSMALMFKNIGKKNLGTMQMVKSFAPMFLSLVPTVLLDSYVTKEQKQSSRVAHMLAINELEDYRYFADYNKKEQAVSNKKEPVKTNEKQHKTESENTDKKGEIEQKAPDKLPKKQAETSKQEIQQTPEKETAQKEEIKNSKTEIHKAARRIPPLQNMNLDKTFSKFM